jgi:hypothetical protein
MVHGQDWEATAWSVKAIIDSERPRCDFSV